MSDHQQNQAVTELKSIKFRRDWNFQFSKSAYSYQSPSFIVHDYGSEKWAMYLTETGCSYALRLSLYGVPKEFTIDLTFEIRIPSSPGYSFSKNYSSSLKGCNEFPDFIDFHSLGVIAAKSPIGNMVYTVCEAELTPLPPEPAPVNIQSQFHIPERDLSHDFGSLYDDETTGDVTLTVTNKKFHAHKLILTARSSVFAAMFRNDMKETITKNVDITDLNADILEQVLRFIYTDQIPNLKDYAIDLLDAADKYDLQNLKAICEKTLYHNVNVESAAEIVVMADRHRAPQLKAQAFRFIKSHMKEVIKTEGYKNLKEHHPGLFVELLEAVATLLS